jgi:GNAT superfamily N-acetyltransferase
MRVEVPIEKALADELLGFWADTFGDIPDLDPAALLGEDAAYNDYYLYVTQRDGRVGGSCMTTHSLSVPSLGGFGEVATLPALRGQGIATDLCRQAVEDFSSVGGQALFLGTGNGNAARIYHRLGWRKLPSTIVWANISGGDSPESFLVDLFRETGQATVTEGGPADRVPMIPLIVTPHDWQVLDANVSLYSSRYAVVSGCMSLYPRYEALAAGGGAWFSAHAGGGRVVGLSTARLDDEGGCRVDGFSHGAFSDSRADLIGAAASWGAGKGVRVWSAVSVEDEEKLALLESLGFREAGPAEDFDMDGRAVGALRLELS